MAKPIDPRDPSKVLENIYTLLTNPTVVNNVTGTQLITSAGLIARAYNSSSINRGSGSYVKLQFKKVAGAHQTITYTNIATLNYGTANGIKTYHVTSPSVASGAVYLVITIYLKYQGSVVFNSTLTRTLPYATAQNVEMDISFYLKGLARTNGEDVEISKIVMIKRATGETGDFSFNAIYSPIVVPKDVNNLISSDTLNKAIVVTGPTANICTFPVKLNGSTKWYCIDLKSAVNKSRTYSKNQGAAYSDLDLTTLRNLSDSPMIIYETTDDSQLSFTGKSVGKNSGTTITVTSDTYSDVGTLKLSNYLVSIDNNAFNPNSSGRSSALKLTKFYIPEEVTSIGMSAFKGCTNLSVLGDNSYIGNNITTIGSGAFMGCNNSNFTIANFKSVQTISDNAFRDCTYLGKINFDSNTLTTIGAYAFQNCNNIKNFISANNTIHVQSLGAYIYIPNGVTSIGTSAFYNCSKIQSVYIPSSVTSIGSSAFYGDTPSIYYENNTGAPLLHTILIDSNSVTSKTYTRSSTLTDIFNSWKTIDGYRSEYQKYYNHEFPLLKFGPNVSSLGQYSLSRFFRRLNDEYTTQGFTNTEWGGSIDTGGNLGKITNTKIFDIENVQQKQHIYSVYFNSNNSMYNKDGGTSDGTQPFRTYWPENIDNLYINYDKSFISDNSDFDINTTENVQTVGAHAFRNSKIRVINIRGINTIQNYGFAGNETMGYAYIDDTDPSDPYYTRHGNIRLKKIQAHAFEGCINLYVIALENTLLEDIGDYAFYNCNKLTHICDNSRQRFTFPRTVKTIGAHAFEGCFCDGDTKIILPKTVTSIGDYAFNGFNSCNKLYIGDSTNMSGSLTIGDHAFYGIGAHSWSEDIKIYKTTPPTIHENTFEKNGFGKYPMVLHVPSGYKQAYLNHVYWKKFSNIIDDL